MIQGSDATPENGDDEGDWQRELAAALDTCACFNFRKVSRAVTQLYDEALHPSGLRSTQLVILLSVAVQPSSNISQLARRLVMDASTLNRNLRPLVQRGLLKLVSGEDGRRKQIALTEEGRGAIDAAVPYWSAAQKRLVGLFGRQRYKELTRQMSTVISLARGP
jgi:DNA-binding MarR family transcriptional regulator